VGETWRTFTVPVSTLGVSAGNPNVNVIQMYSLEYRRPIEVEFDEIKFGNFAESGPTAKAYPTAPIPPTGSGPGLPTLPVSTATTGSVTTADGNGDSSVSVAVSAHHICAMLVSSLLAAVLA
jgi:hypothetical protein